MHLLIDLNNSFFVCNSTCTIHSFSVERHGDIAAAAPVPDDGRVKRILDLGCSVGQSAMGRTIDVIAIGEADPDAIGRLRDERPALLIVAGFDASHTIVGKGRGKRTSTSNSCKRI